MDANTDTIYSFSYGSGQENRYVGFGNTVNPPKKEDDFLNNAMSSLYSVRKCLKLSVT